VADAGGIEVYFLSEFARKKSRPPVGGRLFYNYFFFGDRFFSGKPCFAINARAFSTFLMTKGDLLKSGILGSTVIAGACIL
jgi:hypothetical protein